MTTTDPLTGNPCEVLSRVIVAYPRSESPEERKEREKRGDAAPMFRFTVTQIKPK